MGSKSAIGIGNGICFKQVRDKGGGSYIDPLVRDSIVGLWKFDQNTNESPTRNIIKNTIKGKGGDLELLNFAYKANSGYNGYPEDFTSWGSDGVVKEKTSYTFLGKSPVGYDLLVVYMANSSAVESFKVEAKISGRLLYRYYVNDGDSISVAYYELKEGINTLPYSVDSTLIGGKTGFIAKDFASFEIALLPLYEGALVTDGKDDMIVSQKTVQEMLGGSNVCTVVSMIHQINLSAGVNTSINNIRSESVAHVCARHLNTAYGKTGIFGYSKQLNTTSKPTLINNILGDKKDYIADGNNVIDTTDKYFVQGYKYNDSLYELSEVAVYWTFIANKVLTTDEINQIIAYFKLDKYVTPQVVYDVKRQGLTNDTPAADWYLKDFSGNGHDMQLYNYAKKGNSGIGKYETDFTTWSKGHFTDKINIGSSKIEIIGTLNTSDILINTKPTSMYNVEINSPNKSITIYFQYNDIDGTGVKRISLVEGINKLPSVNDSLFVTSDPLNSKGITIEQIPDYEGALVSDGVDDYGKVENLPIYKDYTVVADREIIDGLAENADGGVAVRGTSISNGAFGFDYKNEVYSFATPNSKVIDVERFISYQSKYVNNGTNINAGNIVDANPLTIGKLGSSTDRYSKLALWSFLLFPYTLSEFLLERQLKRYKLGTLYPGMIEWRPKVNINVPVVTPPTFSMNNGSDIITNGQYIPEGTEITIRIFTTTDSSVGGINEATAKINGVDIELSPSGNKTYYGGKFIVSSKQKIDITIDEYIRYEDIVQPYPAIINLKQDGKTITWGDKLKVGSDIVFVGSANLLPELYTVSETRYNGVTLYPNTIIKVEKSMVFDNARTYLKANEPSCILSPNRLRIPNSSYKILGYIPDLTGKGNHGRLNNFAYAGMSGANGYVEDFTKWSKNSSLDDIEITYDRIKVNKLTGSTVLYVTSNKFINKIKIVASGIPNGGKLTFTQYPDNAIENNKEFEIGGVTTTGSWGFSIKEGLNLDWSNLVIQQIGEHEGSICFDGTDDHITIPTLAHGGKCVMMKVNWSNNGMLYDQRLNSSVYTFGILTGEATLAYNARNNGSTYIDGILNANIIPSDLVGITHNITAVNDAAIDNNTVSPRLGVSVSNAVFSNQALYEFMLFPEIPSEDEIKKLNDVMGVEGGYVESPNYYWDAYGKKNTDTDRNLIADQVSKDVANALEVKNVGYNSESGYSQIVDTVLFKNWIPLGGTTYMEYTLVNDTTINITKSNRVNIDAFYCRANVKKKSYYKITGLQEGQGIQFGFTNNIIYTAESDGVHEVDWSLVSENYQELSTTFVGDCNITIEQVAQYPNGLVSDGVEDHLINTAMPILTDYTWIVKRKWLDLVTYQTFVHKGAGINSNAAFLFEYIEGGFYTRSFSNVGEGKEFPELISYQTKNNYNGTSLTPGSISDGNQLRIFMGSDQYPRYTKAVFYKAMLYDKTVDQLSINMLKNLFERDELIDITNPIFKKEEL